MAIGTKAKENLRRLLYSVDSRHHDLALQMLGGLPPNAELEIWLYQLYLDLEEEAGFGLEANLSPKDICAGKVLSFLFGWASPKIIKALLAHFSDEKELWLPYTTDTFLPPAFAEYVSHVQVLRWRRGCLQNIDKNIQAFTQLQILDLRWQPISKIHPYIADLPLLRELHLISTSFIPPELSERSQVEIITNAPY